MEIVSHNQKKTNLVINIVSVVVPVVVAILLGIDQFKTGGAPWVHQLPKVNAILNSTTSVLLLIGLAMIKAKKIPAHKAMMLTSFALGGLFLVCYIIYHLQVPGASYGDVNFDGALSDEELVAVGSMRLVYLGLLISHIVLAIVALPFVLRAMAFALVKQWDRHRKVVKYAFPLWLYVSITGVIVYLMISPYYG